MISLPSPGRSVAGVGNTPAGIILASDVALFDWHDTTVDAPSAAGNLYDVVADVTWAHEDGTTTRVGQAFYSGTGTDFVFRLGAEKQGTWTGTTTSAVAELNGLEIVVEVGPQSNNARTGFHIFDAANPTWWKQQTVADPVNGKRIAPRLIMWDSPEQFDDDYVRLQAHIDDFADNHGFNGANPPNISAKWFNIDHSFGSDNRSFDGTESNPDPATFRALEELIDRWLDKGGSVHLWMFGDTDRGESADNITGGMDGTIARRLYRYIAARLGPVPGWSMGLGFDLTEWTTAAEIGTWIDRVSVGDWFHWFGGRYGPDTDTQNGLYTATGIAWNEVRAAPPMYASWEQFENLTTEAEIDTGTSVSGVDDRPPFSEDRFRRFDTSFSSDPKHFATDAELLPCLEKFGERGWAAIYGRLVDGTYAGGAIDSEFTSDPWPNAANILTSNQAIDALMEGS